MKGKNSKPAAKVKVVAKPVKGKAVAKPAEKMPVKKGKY